MPVCEMLALQLAQVVAAEPAVEPLLFVPVQTLLPTIARDFVSVYLRGFLTTPD